MTEELQQGSAEWIAARLGKVTASRISDVMAKTKSGAPSEMRANYMADLITERLTGKQAERYVSAAMQWGTDTEAAARASYQFEAGVLVQTVGFVDHPRISMSGASPDGYVGSEGLIEAKCPETKTHINTLLGASVDGRYVKQIQWQLGTTGRKWCDFISFDPRMPESMQIHITRVHRDDKLITELEAQVREFLSELDAKLAALTSRYGTPVREAA
jgi:putative phage-type endonuclease